MKQLTIFRILTFILVPIAALFGGIGFFTLLLALSNPQLLFAVFLLLSFAIYVFTSLTFLYKGIDPGKQCKPSLKDWIRVNAFVAGFLGIAFLQVVGAVFFSNPSDLQKLYDQTLEMQPNMSKMMNFSLYLSMLRGVGYFFLFISIALFIHIPLNFRLMKKYAHLFGAAKTE